jgi:NADPH2:quinone reductase
MAADQSVMRAVFVSEPGGPEKLLFTKSEPIPVPSDGEVLIKHSYAGVNFADVYYRQGIYRAPKGYPLILGLEAAGVVTAAEGTNTTGIRVGDRVIYLGFSGYADYSVQAASSCIKIPHGLSDEDAVGVFLMGMTALSLVQEAYPVQKGQTVLVHAAAGGLGLLLCQLIRSIGATTIGTAGGPEKCAIAEENGAHHVIDYKDLAQPRWEDQVMLLTGGEGVDVVSWVLFSFLFGKEGRKGGAEIKKEQPTDFSKILGLRYSGKGHVGREPEGDEKERQGGVLWLSKWADTGVRPRPPDIQESFGLQTRIEAMD